eukprot:TRINITY_DN2864_c0_g1_i1.p1 TRINITY_DN2864_c0_g1~~TRINITY_DN2864_c0_g1_i1.p1  ORF type:complete len:286 (+),score=82.74 TRINITY_DN2864_c0_g1_i1:323-1180(+)
MLSLSNLVRDTKSSFVNIGCSDLFGDGEDVYDEEEDEEDGDGDGEEEGDVEEDDDDDDDDDDDEDDDEDEIDEFEEEYLTETQYPPGDDTPFLSHMLSSILSHYGTIGWILFRGVARSKLYVVEEGRGFVAQMLGVFLRLVRSPDRLARDTYEQAEALRLLMASLPSLDHLKQLVFRGRFTLKEGVIIATLLDMHSLYATSILASQAIYLDSALPIAQEFYLHQLSAPSLRLITSQYRKLLGDVSGYTNEFTVLDTKAEYQHYLTSREREVRNLMMGTDESGALR